MGLVLVVDPVSSWFCFFFVVVVVFITAGIEGGRECWELQ